MSVSLRDLGARFVRLCDADGRSMAFVRGIEDAQGVLFLCPKCYEANGGPRGTHTVLCWFLNAGVGAHVSPGPGRWIPEGTGIDDLSFVGPSSASVGLASACRSHGFVRDGVATT